MSLPDYVRNRRAFLGIFGAGAGMLTALCGKLRAGHTAEAPPRGPLPLDERELPGRDEPPMPAVNGFLNGTHHYKVQAWTFDAWDADVEAQERERGSVMYLPGVGMVAVHYDRPYGRWEHPGFRDAEQPNPLTTEVESFPGNTSIVIWRTWDDDAPQSCKLCYECSARKGKGDQFGGRTFCMTQAPGDVTEAEAPLYCQRGTDFYRPWVRVAGTEAGR